MMKKQYNSPFAELLSVGCDDIVRTSTVEEAFLLDPDGEYSKNY